jgi:hypothetical protein
MFAVVDCVNACPVPGDRFGLSITVGVPPFMTTVTLAVELLRYARLRCAVVAATSGHWIVNVSFAVFVAGALVCATSGVGAEIGVGVPPPPPQPAALRTSVELMAAVKSERRVV